MSGKMVVLQSLLKMWEIQKRRVLLFCQTRQMLDVMEIFVKKMKVEYLRMD
eukprot:Pgem_evm1s12417